MNPALALEQLMLHPKLAQFAELARAAMPTALVDQVDAASDDAHQFMHAVARHVGDESAQYAAAQDVPEWVRLTLLDAFTTWASGRGSTCRHQPTPDRPEPVLAAAWRPGLVACMRCAHLTGLPSGSAKDRTCDRCGRVCAGLEHGDGIHPGMVQLGPLIYQYGTCRDCRPSTASDNPPSATQTAEQAAPRGTGRVRPRGSRGRSRGKGGRR